MPKSEAALRVFKAFSGKVVHASINGERTLCGRSIDSIWTEMKLASWQDFYSKCPRCKFKADRVSLAGEQSTLVETTKETTE